MARPHSTYRTLAALALLGVAMVVMAMMGRWQLHRADERLAVAAAIENGRRAAPVTLTGDLASVLPGAQTGGAQPSAARPYAARPDAARPGAARPDAARPDAALSAWQPAEASGVWQTDKTVLLENRNFEGRPGYWIATPLVLDPSASSPQPAVLVLRGWMPRSMTATGHPVPPAPMTQTQTVRGELALHVPRLFELGGGQYSLLPDRLGTDKQAIPAVQNLALEAYAQAAALRLVPAVLQQMEPTDDGLVHDWPQPSIDYNQNRGYAMQWFAFAAIAAGAFATVAYRAWRRRHAASTRPTQDSPHS